MEQKRKIVIPLGGSNREAGAAPANFSGDVTVPTPRFDEEATLYAQPVVPLSEAASTASPRRFPLIALLIVLAVGAGVAGGFAIGVYKSSQNRQPETAGNATTTTTASTTASSGADARPSAPLPVLASEKSSEPPARTTATEPATETATERSSASSRDKKSKADDEQIIPPVEIQERRSSKEEKREAKSERSGRSKDDDNDDEDAERVARRQRREQRRRARQAEDQNVDFDRQIERAGQEVNRIREIFEGQRP